MRDGVFVTLGLLACAIAWALNGTAWSAWGDVFWFLVAVCAVWMGSAKS